MNKKIRTSLRATYKLFAEVTGLKSKEISKKLTNLAVYINDFGKYNSMIESDFTFYAKLDNIYPCLGDRHSEAGVAKGEYFHQDIWVAKKIFETNPKEHWDIGSRIDGFISHLLVFRKVNVIDIRNLKSTVPGLFFIQGNITSLPLADNSIESLSCLHTTEHIGLGRYGDPLDPLGSFKAIQELQRVLAPGGKIYFSVPIGQERVEFNAHRIFDPQTIINNFSLTELIDFAVINCEGDLLQSVDWKDFRNVRYACGLFVFIKQHT